MISPKRSLAWVLLVTGLLSLIGCIWIPGSFKSMDGKPRPETFIGNPAATNPFGWVKRPAQELYKLLGPPDRESNNHRAAFYHYAIDSGGFLFICGFGLPTASERFLRVDFDEHGTLRAYKVFKDEMSAWEKTP